MTAEYLITLAATLLIFHPRVAEAAPPPTTGTIIPAPSGVVGGVPVEACGWAPTLERGGCTASLIHPRAISTAQHCGPINSVVFTDAQGGPSQTVGVLACVDTGSQDARICELAEAVDMVPPAPVLFGCEVDAYLQVDQPVTMAGFGLTSFGDQGSYGTKRWGDQIITAVEAGRIIVGNPGDPISPCPGDSGGPIYVQVDDGSWRTIATVLGGTTNTPCNSAADFQRLDVIVPHFESETGIDITPCFDGMTGAWDPGTECGGFYAGDHTGAGTSGTWNDWCAGAPASGDGAQCGAPFGGEGDGDGDPTGDGDGDPTGDGDGDPIGDGDGDPAGETGGEGDSDSGADSDSDTATGEDTGTGETGGDAGAELDEAGCSCTTGEGGDDGRLAWLLGLPILLTLGRRRQG